MQRHPSLLWTRPLSVLVAAVAIVGGTQAVASQDAAAPVPVWSYVFKKGDILRYRTYIKIQARLADDTGDISITTKSTSRHDIKDVLEDGTTVYEQADETSEATFNGMPVVPDKAAPKPKPVVVTLSNTGLMVKRVNPQADPFDPADKAIRAIMAVPVPTMPVKVGDTWKTDFPSPLLKNKVISATSTYQGTEKVLGLDALKIEIKMDFPTAFGADDSETVHLVGTYYVDVKEHHLLRAQYVVKNAVLPFPAKNVEARFYLSRLVPGQNDTEDPEGAALIATKK